MDVLDKLIDSVEDRNSTNGSGNCSNSSWNETAVIQIRDEIKTMVLAGHETSASMLNWALIELMQSKNKECMTHAVKDADNAWRTDTSPNDSSTDTAATADVTPTDSDSEQQQQLQQQQLRKQPLLDLSALDYTEACLKEALRKYSIVPILSRLCIRDVVIDGPNGIQHHVPKGTIVMMLTQGVHHRDDIWPKSAEYIPERYTTAKPEPFTFLPFIDGPRNCLGQNLSLLESKVVLSMLLRKYEFEFADDLSESGACRKHKWLIPVIPHHDTMVTVKKRVVLS
jgi:cytochrome P450